MAMTIEDRLNDLERRVGELEGQFGFLTRQVSGVHKSLLAFQAETNERFDRIDSRLHEMDGKIDRIETKVDAMPEIVADAVTTALRS